MYSKKYMYDPGQNSCLRLIEDGYVHTFEEVLSLIKTFEKVREEAELGLEKTMPKDFRKETEILMYIEENLKEAEEATRKETFEDNYRTRMKLGKYFHGLDGYHWLAEYFYKSSQMYGCNLSVDVKLKITSLQQQALLEERRGNTDIALKYLEKALKLAKKDSLDAEEPIKKLLNGHLCRIYQILGIEYLEKESDDKAAKKSMSLRFFKKAARIAMESDDVEQKATSQALLGKALMKFNKDDLALKCFELYIELSEEYDDKYGLCQGYFAKSEIFKRSGDFESSIAALNRCQELARENHFDSPLIFSLISLGQIETAKRKYLKAENHFEHAFNILCCCSEDFSNKNALMKLTKVMYGIGKAHLSFSHLITTLQSPKNLHLPKILSWRNTGGVFKGEMPERKDDLTDLEEIEAKDEAELNNHFKGRFDRNLLQKGASLHQ